MSRRLGFFALCVALCFTAVTRSAPAVAARAGLPPGFTRVPHASGLVSPTAFAFQGKKILAAELQGTLRVIGRKGTLRAKPYVTLNVSSDVERGLLGVAVDPKYSENHFVYVYYTTGPGAKRYSGVPVNRVSRFKTVKGVGRREKILADNIPSDTGYHNGGKLFFGLDDKLYAAVGDAGLYRAARAPDNLRGKILRLHRDGSAPKDNPFYNVPGADPRIFAVGFRNPFSVALRHSNSTYIVGDVGYNTYEELDSLMPGADYGWWEYEGPCLLAELADCDPAQTDFGTTVPPLHYYQHTTGEETGNAIIAGAFANHSNYPPPYDDALLYADWVSGWVHALVLDATNRETARLDFDRMDGPVAFATGPGGNIYVASFAEGAIYKYVYTP